MFEEAMKKRFAGECEPARLIRRVEKPRDLPELLNALMCVEKDTFWQEIYRLEKAYN